MSEVTLPRFVDDIEEDDLHQQRIAERRRRFTGTIDIYLVVTVGVLVSIGLMMVWSTTFYWAEPQSALFMQQARNALFGLVLMLLIGAVDYHLWRRLALPVMALIILALVGLLILPNIRSVFGARRAYFDGGWQPSEISMYAVVIYMAAWLSSKQSKLKKLTYGLLPFSIMVGIVVGLIGLEPDLSTSALILATASLMFFLAGADWLQIGLTGVFFGAVAYLGINTFDYAKSRVATWIELLNNPILAKASHAQNVIVAFLNGGVSGVGLGQGYQKFFNLPAPHTDSILAVVGEELGLIGCALIIALYVLLLVRGFRISRNAPDMFGSLLAAGVTLAIVLEALFNIAVIASVVPFTGVPLPFISFGGSSLVASMCGIGLLISVSRTTAKRSTPVRKVNETLNLAGSHTISRVRQRPME